MNSTPDANAPESTDSSAELALGQQVGGGRYTLKRLLGRGGMGVVWLAWDERLQQSVALKFLPSQIQSDPVALDEMRRETARSIRLSHPNIIRIHDLHEIAGREAFIAMEYVEGLTLHALRVEQPGRVFSWTFLQPLVKQLCAALDHAHAERVIHRDLKPANMMLDARGRLKLADFGIAAVVNDSLSRVSLNRPTSGTPTHMSPQQMNGQRPRVTDDIYSFGASLYELLTSRPPFYTGDIAHQVLDVPATPMEDRLADLELTNEIPPDVAAMVMACLAKDPTQRPQSARAVAEWIGVLLETDSKLQGSPVAASAAPDALPGVKESGIVAKASGLSTLARRWWPLGWVIAALVVLCALSLYWAIHRTGGKANARGTTATNGEQATSAAARANAMVFIPPGKFRMGSSTNEVDRYDDEGPQTAVTISRGFWMGKYEVTQGEYLAVMGSNPSTITGDSSRPVETVRWDEAATYCRVLTQRERAAGRIATNSVYRLPTEAEWEYACRAGTSTRFSYGDDPGYTNLTNYAWYLDNSGSTSHPVGQKLPNPWGLYDMHGSNFEWCQDWFSLNLPGGNALDPQGPATGSQRVLRSGFWFSRARDCRSAHRQGVNYPGSRGASIGFRVVLAPGQP